MKQYEIKLPDPIPGTTKRLLKTTSGRQLKMAGTTTNATILLEQKDILHLFDIDENGTQHHVAQLAMSLRQTAFPKLVPVGYKPPPPVVPTAENSQPKSADLPGSKPAQPAEVAPPAPALTLAQKIAAARASALK